MLLMTGAVVAPSAKADMTSRMTSSVQLQVNAAATQMQRIGSSFSITGNNVDTTDGTTANTISAGTITSGVYAPGTIAAVQDDPGESFSFTQAFTQADAIDTTGPDIGDVSAYGDQLSTAAGSAGSLAGTVTSQGALTVTAGGAGTVATGQFVTELQLTRKLGYEKSYNYTSIVVECGCCKSSPRGPQLPAGLNDEPHRD